MAFKPNENLAGALHASLRIVEIEKPPMTEQSPIEHSPLEEVAADSIDLELDRINENLIAGTPEKITDEKLEILVDLYRAQALKWEVEEANKKPRGNNVKKKSHVEAMEL